MKKEHRMAKKQQRWLYGELLLKKWGISPGLLEGFVGDGLALYGSDGVGITDIADGVPGSIEFYKFKLEDVERFEKENNHLFEVVPTPLRLNSMDKENEEGELGKRMSAQEVASLVGMDVKIVRKRYKELGGMRLGRNITFFERRVKDAIQTWTEVGSPSAEGRESAGEEVSYQEGSGGVGSHDGAKASKRMEQEDRHGLHR
jgi:hypothetical protein